MLCEICHKKAAAVHVTEINHGTIAKESHLCDECARQKGIPYKVQLSLSEILSGLIEPVLGKLIKEVGDLKCSVCGMNYAQFRLKTRFGCANDYEVFSKGITPLLEKIHGAIQHHGKIPQRTNPQLLQEKELYDLQRELERLVRSEEFEKAAEIRDKIKQLKNRKHKAGHKDTEETHQI